MKALTDAIWGKCTSATDLYADIGGRLFKGRAPQGAEFPYVVFFVVSDIPEYPGGKTIEQVMVQFSIFAREDAGHAAVENILTHLRSLYDDCSLTITSNTLIYFIRGNFVPMHDEIDTKPGTTGVFHYMQEYDCQIVRT